jgi:hypothetical protein
LCLCVIDLFKGCTSVPAHGHHKGTCAGSLFLPSDPEILGTSWISNKGLVHVLFTCLKQLKDLNGWFQDFPFLPPVYLNSQACSSFKVSHILFISRPLSLSTEGPCPSLPDQSLTPSFQSQYYNLFFMYSVFLHRQ